MTVQPGAAPGGSGSARHYDRRPPARLYFEGAPKKRKRGTTTTCADPVADAAAFLKSRARQKAVAATDHGFSNHDVDQTRNLSYRVGMRVEHEMLGVGTIEEVEGIGELVRLTIRFGEDGRKRLLARFARLVILDSMVD